MIFLFRFLHNHEENSWSKHTESIKILVRDQKIKVEGLIYAKFSDKFWNVYEADNNMRKAH